MVTPRPTITTAFRKGQPCPLKPIICQEGYCQDCFIYQNQQIAENTRSIWMHQADSAERNW